MIELIVVATGQCQHCTVFALVSHTTGITLKRSKIFQGDYIEILVDFSLLVVHLLLSVLDETLLPPNM